MPRKAKSATGPDGEAASSEANVPKEAMTTTAIHLPKATLSLLRRVAVARADDAGGRPSVSAVLVTMVESAREELEHEIDRASLR